MSTDELKINIAQRIFNLSDERILHKINEFLKAENVVGYNLHGSLIPEKMYIEEMEAQQERINQGTAKFYTSEEVQKKIMDENHLGR